MNLASSFSHHSDDDRFPQPGIAAQSNESPQRLQSQTTSPQRHDLHLAPDASLGAANAPASVTSATASALSFIAPATAIVVASDDRPRAPALPTAAVAAAAAAAVQPIFLPSRARADVNVALGQIELRRTQASRRLASPPAAAAAPAPEVQPRELEPDQVQEYASPPPLQRSLSLAEQAAKRREDSRVRTLRFDEHLSNANAFVARGDLVAAVRRFSVGFPLFPQFATLSICMVVPILTILSKFRVPFSNRPRSKSLVTFAPRAPLAAFCSD